MSRRTVVEALYELICDNCGLTRLGDAGKPFVYVGLDTHLGRTSGEYCTHFCAIAAVTKELEKLTTQ